MIKIAKHFQSKVAKIMGTQIMICQKLSTSSETKQINIDDIKLIDKIMVFDLILIENFQNQCCLNFPSHLLDFILRYYFHWNETTRSKNWAKQFVRINSDLKLNLELIILKDLFRKHNEIVLKLEKYFFQMLGKKKECFFKIDTNSLSASVARILDR